VIAECGARLHLAHPLGIAGYENRRVKNDIRDATLLADLLRLGRLPEAWVAPPEVRELRELIRYRARLGRLRAGLKTQVHQVLGKEGVIPELDDTSMDTGHAGSTSSTSATSTWSGSSRCVS
jgi:transposase